MTWDMLLIAMVCAGGAYFLLKKSEKRIWKILSFLGVWFVGFVLTIVVGLYVSTELHANDLAVMNRYMGNSIVMPLLGVCLGLWVRRLQAKKK